ncbi:MAG: TIGR04282 family arsenosugar biosynthesis glycosyltransferase [Mycobacteriales bacterium]
MAVLIMARAPQPGTVKTRLQPLLGPDGCARLQAGLLRRTVLLAECVAPLDTYLALDHPGPAAAAVSGNVTVLGQRGRTLGDRMWHAVEDVLDQHPGPVVVIGTDTPTLSPAHLRAAASVLETGHDAVFGPALDGGYYLLGLRRSAPALFAINDQLWGGPSVLEASLTAARTAGLRTALLEPLRDLDTPQDARAFLDEAGLPADIAALLDLTALSS